MHILVTGGAGYIGSHVVKQLLENTDHDVSIIDNLSTGHRQTLDTLEQIALESGRGDVRFYHADLSDFKSIEKIFMTERFDAVLHFAASIVVPESVENPLKYYMNNTVNTTNLIRCCNDYGVGKFIFSSTAAVYGEPDMSLSTSKIDESYETRPINPYGMSKLMSETVIRDTAAANPDFNYVILRYFNVAGADIHNVELQQHSESDINHSKLNIQNSTSRPRIGQSFPNATHLIKVAAQTALGKRDRLMVFGDDYDTPDGTCIRDYIHVEDLASAHLAALSYLGENPLQTASEPNIFNVGYGHGFSVLEVIEAVKSVSGIDFTVEIAPRRAGDPAQLVSDNTKIRTVLRWEPRYDDLRIICETALNWEKQL